MSRPGSNRAELEEFALELAQTASGIARAHFRRPLAIENKQPDGFDPVTAADRAIERVLRGRILERFPDHGIVGEEHGEHTSDSRYTWYLDPIDGTRAFLMGSPLWGTLIGLTESSAPLFGLLCQPVLEEIFLGTPQGSWLIKPDGRARLTSRPTVKLDRALLACTDPGMFTDERLQRFEDLTRRCLLRRFGGDCYNYAMLAAGFVDLVVEGQLKPYDIVPLVPLLQGAGCVVTDWRGGLPLDGGFVVAAANAELHRQALAVLQAGD
jgi:histidinol phosphatase-like enzyme (inositol monophosphatase family)